MPKTGDELKADGEAKEAAGETQPAADDYYQAMKQYEKEGKPADAQEMRDKATELASKFGGDLYVDELDKQAKKIDDRAEAASLAGNDDGQANSSSELWPRA